jgi:DNA-binding XRE family transcriptional regulator
MAGRTPPEPIRPFELDFSPLRRLRRFHDYTQAEIARAVGIHKITFWRLETGKLKNPSLKQLIAIGRALGVPYNELYTVVEPQA